MRLTIYADGACSNNGAPVETRRGGVGAVILTDTDIHSLRVSHAQIEEKCKQLGYEVTNSTAELCALGFALNYIAKNIPGDHELDIYTDSNYVVGQVRRENRFKTNANVEMVAKLRNTVDKLNFKITHIDGHQRPQDIVDPVMRKHIEYQVRVDALAVEGKTQESQSWVAPLSGDSF